MSANDLRHLEVFAQQLSETISKQQARIAELEAAVEKAREAIDEIVISEGIDAGVILLSDDSPTHFSEAEKCHMYEHEYFSPLVDALVSLARLLKAKAIAAQPPAVGESEVR